MNWPNYNQSLVRRGEILIGFDVLDNLDVEIKEMNKDKVGEPFHYPNTFLLLRGYAKVYFHLPYRQTQGIEQGHGKGKVPSIPDYSTISRRINRLNIRKSESKSMESEYDYVVIAIDSTGIKVTNRGQWMRDKWHVRKGYLKIHIAVDVKSKKILSMKVTDEHVHDGKTLPDLVEDVIKPNNMTAAAVGKLLADGTYDSNGVFRYLADSGILPCIKLRKNARVRLKTGHILRNLSVLAQRNGLQGCKDSVSYGKRWMAETVFSCIKRTFGECLFCKV